jgi:hypothetical protein
MLSGVSEVARWDMLFAQLRTLSTELAKVDSGMSALREQLGLLETRFSSIEEALVDPEDEEEDSEDEAFIDDTDGDDDGSGSDDEGEGESESESESESEGESEGESVSSSSASERVSPVRTRRRLQL